MAWGLCVALFLLLPAASPGQDQWPHLQPGPRGLWYHYECGVKGMQLLVYPPPSQSIHFKGVDEFGTLHQVNNCTICYHWVSAPTQAPVIFYAEYRGCLVLEKDGRFHLRVRIEALQPTGRLVGTEDVTLTCPKANDTTEALDLHPLAPLSLPSAQPLPLGPHRTFPSPPYTQLGFILPTPASPTHHPEPTFPTPTPPERRPWELWEVDTPPTYMGTRDAWGTPSPGPAGGSGGPTAPAGPRRPPRLLTLETCRRPDPSLCPPRTTTNPGARAQERCQGVSEHIPCRVGRSKTACQQAGCCYDHTGTVPCYYGNTVTVQCFRDGHVVLVVSRETALAHRVSLAGIRLAFAPHGCPPGQVTGSFVIFRFPLTHCGTTLQVVGNQLIYENELASDRKVQVGPQGSITRDGTFRLHVRCVFNTSDFLPIQASILPALLPTPTWVHQAGPLRMELRIAKDATFSSYYQEGDYPVVRLLREPVPVEVRLLQRTDPSLVLVLHQCWATPSVNPFEQPQWPLLSDGCPFQGDNYRTQMVAVDAAHLPFPSHYQRFTVATFALLDPGSPGAPRKQVYFFCSASVCSRSGSQACRAPCRTGTARQRRSSGSLNDTAVPQNIVSSPGPVSFQDSYMQEAPRGPTGALSWRPDPRALLWGLFLLLLVSLAVGAVGLRRVRARAPRGSRE